MTPRRVVLTGAPCSGKSTALESFRDIAIVGPEVASIIIRTCKFMPTYDGPFERLIYRWQVALEDYVISEAIDQQVPLVVFDRGRLDPAGFIFDGLQGFQEACDIDLETEYAAYDKVIQLAVPTEEVYAQCRANNPARIHDYAESCKYDESLRKAWEGHPNFVYVDNGGSWDDKLSRVIREAHG